MQLDIIIRHRYYSNVHPRPSSVRFCCCRRLCHCDNCHFCNCTMWNSSRVTPKSIYDIQLASARVSSTLTNNVMHGKNQPRKLRKCSECPTDEGQLHTHLCLSLSDPCPYVLLLRHYSIGKKQQISTGRGLATKRKNGRQSALLEECSAVFRHRINTLSSVVITVAKIRTAEEVHLRAAAAAVPFSPFLTSPRRTPLFFDSLNCCRNQMGLVYEPPS